MTDSVERQTVVDLLNRLGDERDEDVLAAARTLHTQIAASGLSWEELLVPEDGETEPELDEPELDEPELDEPELEEPEPDQPDETADERPSLPPVGDNADTLELIEKLLARPGNSDEFREELEDYKSDLADGDFEESDHRYVQALYARLSKS